MLVMEMTLNHSIEMLGKPVEVTLTENARNALSRRIKPLIAEMELYFSCLIRKQVRFYDTGIGNDEKTEFETRLNDRLRIRFRPIMSKACSMDDVKDDKPPVTDFPIANSKAYIPNYLNIDFKNNEWVGEFGYRSKK